MSKKFIVRLRKGGVTGNIVANSQIITIDPLTGNTIFPSNFTDLRLQGKLVTNDRVSNFIKTIIPVPTTTTTTTTAGPGTTTTTTTTAGPGSTTTTTTTQGTQFSISVSPFNINAGGTATITVTHRNYTQSLWLYVLRTGAPAVSGLTLRPAPQDIVSPNFTDADQFMWYKFTPRSGSAQTVISIKFNDPLTWLIKDLTRTIFLQTSESAERTYEVARAEFKLAYNVSPYSIDAVNKTYSRPNQIYDANRAEINPGDTIQVTIYGLTAGTSYALAMEHTYAGSANSNKDSNFNKNWFTIQYDGFTSSYAQWSSGGTYTNDEYPSPYIREGSFDSVPYYYNPFRATSTSHVVEIPVSAIDNIKKIYGFSSSPVAIDAYDFTFYLTSVDGKTHYTLNSAAKNNDGTTRYNGVTLKSKFPILTLQSKGSESQTIYEGGSDKATFYIKANRNFRPSELPYKLVLLLFRFQFGTPSYVDNWRASDFVITGQGMTGAHVSSYSNCNWVTTITNASLLTTQKTIEIAAPADNDVDFGVVSMRLIGFPSSLESSVNANQYNPATTFDPTFIHNNGMLFSVYDAAVRPVTITNESITKSRDEGGDQQEYKFVITSANYQTLVNGTADSDIYINGLFHYKNSVDNPRGTTILAYSVSTAGFLPGFPVTFDTHLSSYETEINALLNGIGRGQLLVMYSRDAFTLFQSTRDILNNKFGGTSTFIHQTLGGPTGRYGWIFVGHADVRTNPTVERLGQLQIDEPVKVNYTVLTGNTPRNQFKYTFTLTSTSATTVYWKFEGTNITAGDFEGPINGNFAVSGSTPCQVLATIKADKVTEGSEEFTVKLYTDNAPGALPFHSSDAITITDTSVSGGSTSVISETVTLGPKDVYWRDEAVTFSISGGDAGSSVKITAPNAGEFRTITLSSNGSWSGTVELFGEPTGTPIPITFRFANGVVKEVQVTLVYRTLDTTTFVWGVDSGSGTPG